MKKGHPPPKKMRLKNTFWRVQSSIVPLRFEPDSNITQQKRSCHSKRAAIEPIIGHLKQDYRMGRNFLKGIIGDQVNVILAAAAMNFKRVINLWKKEANLSWQPFCKWLVNVYWDIIVQTLIMTF